MPYISFSTGLDLNEGNFGIEKAEAKHRHPGPKRDVELSGNIAGVKA